MSQKYGIPFSDLPSHCLDAVDAAERTRARTLIVRGAQAIAAIVPMNDFDQIDPPDPGASGQDPLLALCGSCRHDSFVDAFMADLHQTTLWSGGRPMPREVVISGPATAKAGSPPTSPLAAPYAPSPSYHPPPPGPPPPPPGPPLPVIPPAAPIPPRPVPKR